MIYEDRHAKKAKSALQDNTIHDLSQQKGKPMSIGTGEDGFTEQEPTPRPADDWPWLLGLGLGVVTLGVLAATALKKARDERFSAACASSAEKDDTPPISESRKGEDMGKEKNTETKEIPYEFVDMTPFIRGDKVIKNYGNYKCSGEDDQPFQLLKDAFDVEWVVLEKYDAEWVVLEKYIGYKGFWFGIFKKDGHWYLLNGCFGPYEVPNFSHDHIEWLLGNVKNVRAFSKKETMMMWLRETEDYSHEKFKDHLIAALSSCNETPDGSVV